MDEHHHTKILELDGTDLERVTGGTGNWVTDTIQTCSDIVWSFSFPAQLAGIIGDMQASGRIN